MSARSLSVSWANDDSFPREGPSSLSSRHLNPFPSFNNRSSSSTAFFSFNTAQWSEHNTHAPRAAGQYHTHTLDELAPWRTPQDCREGGLALLYSMQEILTNVQRARLSSVQEVYAPVRHTSPATSSANGRDAHETHQPDGSSSLRLSMRQRHRRPQPTTAIRPEDDGDVRNTSLSSEGNAAATTSHAEAETKAATLMDYILPSSSSSARQPLHMWLDDSKTQRTAPSPTTSACETASTPSFQGDGESAVEGGQRWQAQSEEEMMSRRGSTGSAAGVAAAVNDHAFALPPVLRPSTQTCEGRANVVSTPPTAEVVPAIPRFDELKLLQEKYQQHLEAHQQPHPRSEAARCKAHALMHSSEDEQDDDDEDNDAFNESHDGSPPATLQTITRLAPDGGNGTARPAPPPPLSSSSSRPFTMSPDNSSHRQSSFSSSSQQRSNGDFDKAADEQEVEEDEEVDDVSDHMSATNFGEGGHLACVPGDTLHNRYTLLRALGVGRSSRVWLAADLEQCSLARRHLIRELGEREARRLFRPQERPMFVAIKVFRCSAMYTDCAVYEAKLSTFVKDSVRLRQLRAATRSPPSRSMSLVVSPTIARPLSPLSQAAAAAAAAAARGATMPLVNVSLPPALLSPRTANPPATLSSHGGVSNASSFAGPGSSPHPSKRLTTFRAAFTVEGAFGTHECLVMDVLGSGVDKAINETHLAGFPSEVARSILLSTLQGLSVLAACHVIHTDLKPENLLFTDLEAGVAAEMRAFQASQLQTGHRSGLWSSFTHRRENVLEYSQRKELESASQAALTVDSSRQNSSVLTPEEGNVGGGGDGLHASYLSLSNSGSVGVLQHTCAPQHQGSEEMQYSGEDGEPRHPPPRHCISPTAPHADPTVARVRTEGGRVSTPSRLTSPLLSATRRGRTSLSSPSTPPRRAQRPAYEVRVSDFGLSFITPPCLRLGVRALVRYTEDVGVNEDELVHDDPLSQLQWLYDQQQQKQQQQQQHPIIPAPFATRLAGVSTVDATSRNGTSVGAVPSGGWWSAAAAAGVPEWTAEVDLIDEAELRALQAEEAREDEICLRRKSDGDTIVVDGAVADVPSSAEPQGSDANAASTTAATATDFTSVVDVSATLVGAAQSTRRKKAKVGDEEHLQKETLMPAGAQDNDTTHQRTFTILESSSDSTNDSLPRRRVTASDAADSGMADHLMSSAVASSGTAAAPPMALRTASYHSPVSHPLTAVPSVAMVASEWQSPHANGHEENPGINDRSRAPSTSPLNPLDSPRWGTGQQRRVAERVAEDGEEALYATPPDPRSSSPCAQPLTAAPALLSGRSSAVGDENFPDAPSFTRPSALHLPLPEDATTSKKTADEGSRNSSASPTTASRLSAQRSTLISPRLRRSPNSALASLTALRRLELDIVRNQRYTRGATIQSREYRAPEVLLGNFFLPSCDVWSIGCIAYELVTGRFLVDCIADREHFGRQLARHLDREEKGKNEKSTKDRSATEDDDDDENDVQWDGLPIYVGDDEQDLDIFHLKAMMRLLGPPPISFLRQRPIGLFVEDYFDECGTFRFWEDGEGEESGMLLAEKYRRQELRYWDGQRRRSSGGGGGIGSMSSSPADGFGGDAALPHALHSAALHVYASNSSNHYTSYESGYDNGEEYDRGSRVGSGEGEVMTRVRPYSSLRGFDDPLDSQARVFSSSDAVGRNDYRSTPSTDATPSTLSMTPRSITASAINSYLRSAGATAPMTSSGGGGGAVAGSAAPVHLSGHLFAPHASAPDTRNYPIETEDWVEVRQILRLKLKSEAEAHDFERFLAKCLIWDPAQRATAAELLMDDWMVKYSHKVADAMDSEADDEDAFGDEAAVA